MPSAACTSTSRGRATTRRIANEQDPKALFDRLFAGYAPTNDATAQAAAAKLKRLEGSVLDFVSADATELKGRLGRSDNLKLDEYLSGIRDLERQLQDRKASSNVACSPVAPTLTKDPQQTVKNMLDVIVLALQCDATRVATFMIENGLGDFVYDLPGESMGHHAASHHNGDATMKETCRVIERWEMEQFSVPSSKDEGGERSDGSSLLDNSLVFMSSDVGDGMGHTAYDLPMIIAGKAQGAVTTGRHVSTIGKDPYNFDCSVVPIGQHLHHDLADVRHCSDPGWKIQYRSVRSQGLSRLPQASTIRFQASMAPSVHPLGLEQIGRQVAFPTTLSVAFGVIFG